MLQHEISDLKEHLAGKDAVIQQKDHKLGVFADQLKVQKEKAAQAEAAHRQAEEALSKMAQEAGAVLHGGGVVGGGLGNTMAALGNTMAEGGGGDRGAFSQHGGDFSPPTMHAGGGYAGGDAGYCGQGANGIAQIDMERQMEMERAMMRHAEDLASAQHSVQEMTAELLGVQREKEDAVKTIRAQAIELQQKKGQVETLTAIINRMQSGGGGGAGGRGDVLMDPHIPGGGPDMMDERGWRQTLM